MCTRKQADPLQICCLPPDTLHGTQNKPVRRKASARTAAERLAAVAMPMTLFRNSRKHQRCQPQCAAPSGAKRGRRLKRP